MKSKISTRSIKSSAFSAAVTINMVSMVATIVTYFILSRLFPEENNGIITFISTLLAYGTVSYILLSKLFSALAYEAAQRGVTEEINQKNKTQ